MRKIQKVKNPKVNVSQKKKTADPKQLTRKMPRPENTKLKFGQNKMPNCNIKYQDYIKKPIKTTMRIRHRVQNPKVNVS